jgi:hypothetical protein
MAGLRRSKQGELSSRKSASAHTLFVCLLSLITAAFAIRPCSAENTAKIPISLVAVGVRYGTNTATDKAGALDRVDVFGSWRTPFAWEFTPGWDIGARMNASAGVIWGQGEAGGVGTLVPTLAIGDTADVFSFEAGAGVALFTRWEFGTVEDFGGPLQFILDLGVNFRVYKHFGLGYRFQHWSDGGIHGSDNRGVEMHMLEFSYRY